MNKKGSILFYSLTLLFVCGLLFMAGLTLYQMNVQNMKTVSEGYLAHALAEYAYQTTAEERAKEQAKKKEKWEQDKQAKEEDLEKIQKHLSKELGELLVTYLQEKRSFEEKNQHIQILEAQLKDLEREIQKTESSEKKEIFCQKKKQIESKLTHISQDKVFLPSLPDLTFLEKGNNCLKESPKHSSEHRKKRSVDTGTLPSFPLPLDSPNEILNEEQLSREDFETYKKKQMVQDHSLKKILDKFPLIKACLEEADEDLKFTSMREGQEQIKQTIQAFKKARKRQDKFYLEHPKSEWQNGGKIEKTFRFDCASVRYFIQQKEQHCQVTMKDSKHVFHFIY